MIAVVAQQPPYDGTDLSRCVPQCIRNVKQAYRLNKRACKTADYGFDVSTGNIDQPPTPIEKRACLVRVKEEYFYDRKACNSLKVSFKNNLIDTLKLQSSDDMSDDDVAGAADDETNAIDKFVPNYMKLFAKTIDPNQSSFASLYGGASHQIMAPFKRAFNYYTDDSPFYKAVLQEGIMLSTDSPRQIIFMVAPVEYSAGQGSKGLTATGAERNGIVSEPYAYYGYGRYTIPEAQCQPIDFTTLP